MKIFKKNKYRALLVFSKYSFVFIIAFTLVTPMFLSNKVFGAGEYWGYQRQMGKAFPCGYQDGLTYKAVNGTSQSAQFVCNEVLHTIKGEELSYCVLSADNICPAVTDMPIPYTDSQTPPPALGSGNPDGVNINVRINNPLPFDTVEEFIAKIIEVFLVFAVPIIALAIIYTGFMFVTAQGNEKKLETAKKALTYTLIGAALVLGAFVISKALVSTVEEIKRTT